MKTALIRYDAACRAIAAAKSVDEVKDIRDVAIAMKAYARQAKNKSMEADAAEFGCVPPAASTRCAWLRKKQLDWRKAPLARVDPRKAGYQVPRLKMLHQR